MVFSEDRDTESTSNRQSNTVGNPVEVLSSSQFPLPTHGILLSEISLEQIETDPRQPRRDLGDLTELQVSIASVGLVQPITVTVVGPDKYRIIAGERRFTAVKALGLPRILAVVRTVEEQQRLELQIVENLHRKDLNPVEEARSYQRLAEEFGFTQEQIAGRVGKSRPAINETLRLLSLPRVVLDECRTSDIPKSVLLAIVRQPASEQIPLWNQAKAGALTVRSARKKKDSMMAAPQQNGFTSPQMTFRYPIQTEEALVTLTFNRPKATPDEIIASLEEALAGEKARTE